MPSALAITRSSGVVMNPRTRSALAPTYAVETLTTAMSLRGDRRSRDGDVAARVLADAERADRLQPRDQDHEVDDDGEDRPPDEEIGEFHQLFFGVGAGRFVGRTCLLICIAAPLRSLKTPEVTTSSPGLIPDSMAICSPRDRPSVAKCSTEPTV